MGQNLGKIVKCLGHEVMRTGSKTLLWIRKLYCV